MPRGDQPARQWMLLKLLDHAAGRTINELAAELGVTTRTIRRDLEVLERSGYPIYDETDDARGKVWRLMENFRRLPPVTFSIDEALSLFVARHFLQMASQTPFEKSFASALAKIEKTYSPETLERIRALSNVFLTKHHVRRDFSDVQLYIELITKAISKNLQLKARYYSASQGKLTDRVLAPYHLWYANDNIYLIAFCHQAGEMRVFLLDRFEQIEVTNQPFQRRADFDVELFMESAFGVYITTPEKVVLEFNGLDEAYFAKRVFHPSQQVEPGAKGKVRLILRVGISQELVHWILGFGAGVKVLEPPSLAEEVKEALQKAAGQY